MKKIDIHCHVTTKNLRKDLKHLQLEANNNIKSIFLLPTYFPKKGTGVSNNRLYYNIKDIKLFKMYLSLDFNYFWMHYNEMTELLKDDRSKIVGIKIYTGYQDIDFNSENMKLLIDLAYKYKLPIMFHTGYTKGSGRKNAFNPIDLIMFIQNHHYITFIIAHLGNPFLSEMKRILNQDNIFTDISGMMEDSINFSENDRDYFLELFNNFGASKFLYGTDYPVQTHKQTNKLLKTLSKKDKKQIMYTNIKKVFNV